MRILPGEKVAKNKPWSLQKDGDIWQVFERMVETKGKHTIKITHVGMSLPDFTYYAQFWAPPPIPGVNVTLPPGKKNPLKQS